jgi:glucokinase
MEPLNLFNMYHIAIDLGGRIIKIGLMSLGCILDQARLDSQSSLGILPNLPRIDEVIRTLLSNNGIDARQLSGIGLAFPGLVNPKESKVLSTNAKYDDACGIDFNRWAGETWNVPFYMDNDARLAVVGEWQKGAAAGLDNVVMVTIGTGIGTGVIINGKVLYGKHFQAGSLGGHFVMDYKGRKCTCGNTGCIESLASSFFLPVIIREHPKLSAAFKEKAAGYSFRDIFTLAGQGDEEALLLRNECMEIWAAAVVSYIHAYDPEIVVLGGGIMNSKDVILPYIKEKVDQHAWCPTAKVAVAPAVLGDQAALFGLDYFLSENQLNTSIV